MPDRRRFSGRGAAGGGQAPIAELTAEQLMHVEVAKVFVAARRRAGRARRRRLPGGLPRRAYFEGSIGNFQSQNIVAHQQRLEARAREGNIATCVTIFEQIEREVGQLVDALATTGDRLKCVS